MRVFTRTTAKLANSMADKYLSATSVNLLFLGRNILLILPISEEMLFCLSMQSVSIYMRMEKIPWQINVIAEKSRSSDFTFKIKPIGA